MKHLSIDFNTVHQTSMEDLDVYRSLGVDELRLLELEGAPPWEPLRARLRQMTWGSLPPFVALSYTWGEDMPGFEIHLVDDHQQARVYPIRPNLYDALLQLRPLQGDVVTLWIDALCINQRDTEERNTQVPRMKYIYQKAQSVEAWIGDAGRHMNKDLDQLTYEAAKHEHVPDGDVHLNRSIAKSILWSFTFVALLTRPWFRRTWVLQEAVLAQKLVIRSGYRTFELDMLVRAILAIYTSSKLHNIADTVSFDLARQEELPLNHVMNIFNLRRRLGGGSNSCGDLYQALRASRWCKATDERDQIYGILGLVDAVDAADPNLTTQYDLPFGNVFLRAASLLLIEHGLTSVLDLKGISELTIGAPYPSWIPEWHDPDRIETFVTKSLECRRTYGYRLYKAGGHVVGGIELYPPYTLSISSRYAIFVDKIDILEHGARPDAMSSVGISGWLDYSAVGDCLKWFEACASIARTCEPYANGVPIADALCRTFYANATTELAVAPLYYRDELLNFIGNWNYNTFEDFVTMNSDDPSQAYTAINDLIQVAPLRNMTPLVDWLRNSLEIGREIQPHLPEPSSDYEPNPQEASTFNADEPRNTSLEDLLQGLEDALRISAENRNDNFNTELFAAIPEACRGRWFCRTEKKLIGLVPWNAEAGDEIWVFCGVDAPLVLRKLDGPESRQSHRIVGDCYIHGLMEGQALTMEGVEWKGVKID